MKRKWSVSVPRSSFQAMWDRLEEKLGPDKAVYAVCELVISKAHPRLREVLKQYYRKGKAKVRASDPKSVELLFESDGALTALGRIVLECRSTEPIGAARGLEEPNKRRKGSVSVSHLKPRYWDLVELLSSTAATREQTQSFFRRKYGSCVPRTSFQLIWDRLEEQLGTDNAIDAVCEMVIAKAQPRLRKVFDQYSQRGTADVRASDPKIVELLFDRDGSPTDLGAVLLDRLVKGKTPVEPVAGKQSESSKTERETIPRDVKKYVWQRDGGRCVECGSKELLEYDHIIPLAKGGSNTDRNLQLLCERCNRAKGASIA